MTKTIEWETQGNRTFGYCNGQSITWISHNVVGERLWVRYDAAFPDIQGLMPEGASIEDAKKYIEHWHRVHGVLHPEPGDGT